MQSKVVLAKNLNTISFSSHNPFSSIGSRTQHRACSLLLCIFSFGFFFMNSIGNTFHAYISGLAYFLCMDLRVYILPKICLYFKLQSCLPCFAALSLLAMYPHIFDFVQWCGLAFHFFSPFCTLALRQAP